MDLSPREPHGLCHTQAGCRPGALEACTVTPSLTLQYFLDARETRLLLLSTLLSLDVGQSSFCLSSLSCGCDKTLLPQGMRWPDLSSLFEKSVLRSCILKAVLCLFGSTGGLVSPESQIFRGHIANVNLTAITCGVPKKTLTHLFLNAPKRYIVAKQNKNETKQKNLLRLTVKIPTMIYIFASCFPVCLRLNSLCPQRWRKTELWL